MRDMKSLSPSSSSNEGVRAGVRVMSTFGTIIGVVGGMGQLVKAATAVVGPTGGRVG